MIEMIVLDVDGCLTDGGIKYYEDGNESKSFNVKDGLAIRTWLRMGKEVAIITGRKSAIVQRRSEELGIRHLFQGVGDKAEVIERLSDELGISLEKVAAIGDDLNDLRMLKIVGMSFVPHDASMFVQEIADVVLSRKGGRGAVREMIETIIREDGTEDAFLAFWQ
jgi:3-deoxy-D-manno-octulosonate 8-phosphate phosphatase (KDO 8-P phosphatase)